MNKWLKSGAVGAALCAATSAFAIGISIQSSSTGTLEDAVLFASMAGAAPRYAVPLGDFNLGTITQAVVDVPVGDASSTHWWLIGHQGADIVFTSLQALAGVDVMAVEPFSHGDAFTISTVIAQLDAFNGGGSFTLDIAGLLNGFHSSHVTADGGASDLWRFASPGTSIGQIAISLHDNVPPDIGQAVPEPGSLALLVGSLLGLAGAGRRRLASPAG